MRSQCSTPAPRFHNSNTHWMRMVCGERLRHEGSGDGINACSKETVGNVRETRRPCHAYNRTPPSSNTLLVGT